MMLNFTSIFHPATGTQMDYGETLRYRISQIFVFMLPFPMLYSNIALYLIITTTLIALTRKKIKEIPKQILIFQAIYFLALIGYSYSFNKAEAGFLLERQLTIFALPLILPLAFRITETRLNLLLHTLTTSLIVAILYLLLNAFWTVRELHLPLQAIFSKEFFNHQFSAPIGIHAGYLSLYVALCIFHLLQMLMLKPSKRVRIVIFFCFSVLLTGLFFLASRNTIIASFVIMLVVFPWFYVKRKLLFFGIITLFLFVSFFVVKNINYLYERFSSDLITDIKLNNGSVYNFDGSEPRIKRWESALDLIKKSPIAGYGTGDEITMLKANYIKDGLYISYLESFNAHNQYLSYAIKNGIIGLIIFVAIFTWFLWLAIKGRSYIYLCFLFLLMIGFFTENILDANKGIFFFAFFNTLMGYTILNKKKPIPGEVSG